MEEVHIEDKHLKIKVGPDKCKTTTTICQLEIQKLKINSVVSKTIMEIKILSVLKIKP